MGAITDLEVGIVPHREWALRQWFYANTLWYYHRLAQSHQLNTNPRFYELVDPDLRPLCKMLHDQYIPTTPSCQGHFYPRQHFEDIWHELRLEAVRARDRGLAVRNAESGDACIFVNHEFQLPWDDFDSFFMQAGPHQNTGFIAFVLPQERAGLADQLRANPCPIPAAKIDEDAALSRRLGGPTFCVQVRTSSPREQSKIWNEVTKFLVHTMDGSAATKTNAH